MPSRNPTWKTAPVFFQAGHGVALFFFGTFGSSSLVDCPAVLDCRVNGLSHSNFWRSLDDTQYDLIAREKGLPTECSARGKGPEFVATSTWDDGGKCLGCTKEKIPSGVIKHGRVFPTSPSRDIF